MKSKVLLDTSPYPLFLFSYVFPTTPWYTLTTLFVLINTNELEGGGGVEVFFVFLPLSAAKKEEKEEKEETGEF